MSSSDRTYNEKRDFIRMKINSQVNIKQNGNQYQGICKDLSAAGMLIETEQSFSIGSELDVTISQEGESHLPFHATAEVNRVDNSSAEGQFIVGLSIIKIS